MKGFQLQYPGAPERILRPRVGELERDEQEGDELRLGGTDAEQIELHIWP